MAGRRSKAVGCTSCSRRQIPCDATRPTCLNCRHAGMTCDRWYTREEPGQTVHKWIVSVPRPSYPHLDDNTLFAHLKNVLFRQSPGDKGDAWVGFKAATKPLTALSRNSLLALSQSFYGRARSDPKSSDAGLKGYISCLKIVNRRLGSRSGGSEDTLLAVSILGAYEMLLLTEKTAWAKHYLGTAAILNRLGPQACSDPVVFGVFRSSRFMITLAGVATGTTTCIEQPRWLIEPWIARGVAKNNMDTLQDIMTLLPSITRGSAQSLMSQLDQWFERTEQYFKKSIQVAERAADYPAIWPDPFLFADLTAANEYTMAHSTFIAAIVQIMRSGEVLEPGKAADAFIRANNSAREIVRSVDYLLQPTHAYLGSLFSFWPLRNAWVILRNDSAEGKKWIENRIEQANSGSNSWKAGTESFDYRVLGD